VLTREGKKKGGTSMALRKSQKCAEMPSIMVRGRKKKRKVDDHSRPGGGKKGIVNPMLRPRPEKEEEKRERGDQKYVKISQKKKGRKGRDLDLIGSRTRDSTRFRKEKRTIRSWLKRKERGEGGESTFHIAGR